MKKIITAMGNNKIADELRKMDNFEIATRDIPYREGIIEALYEIPDIDIVIINEILDGQIGFEELIESVVTIKENLEIIVFVEEKTQSIKSFLFSNGIYKIYQNNEIDIATLIDSLGGRRKVTKYNNYVDKEELECYSVFRPRGGKIIAISGAYCSGKSSVSCALAKEYAKQGYNTLIVDFDIFNGSINILLDIPKYNNCESIANIQNQIIKITKNMDALCSLDLLFKNENKVDYINLEDMLTQLRRQYDLILIDTSSNYQYKYIQRILNAADGIIYLIVPSKLEIKKSYSLFEIFIKDFDINKRKIKMILNKITQHSIDRSFISNQFSEIDILTEINYDEQFENHINNFEGKLRIAQMIGG